MRLGIRIPSISKMISARISPIRFVRHNIGLKMPRGWGWFSNPDRALHNRIYNRTTISLQQIVKQLFGSKNDSG